MAASGAQRISDEPASLTRQRLEILSRYEQALRDCETRFAVVDCQDQARRERDAQLAPVRARELALAEAQRQSRTEAQRRRLQAKQLEFAQQDAEQLSRAVQSAAEARPIPASAPESTPTRSSLGATASGGAAVGRPPRPSPEQLEAQARQAAQARAWASRQRQAQAQRHRREVLERNAARDAVKPASPALPLPTKRAAASGQLSVDGGVGASAPALSASTAVKAPSALRP